MQFAYPAVFYESDGAYVVEVPDLPGCVSWDDTLAGAINMGIEAASGWLLCDIEEGKPIPKASHVADIRPDPEIGENAFVTMLVLDMDAFEKKYGKKSVRKSFTIPAWLNAYAESNGISYSEVLRESLTDMYVREHQVPYEAVK